MPCGSRRGREQFLRNEQAENNNFPPQLVHAVLWVSNHEITISLPPLQRPPPDAGPQGPQTLRRAHKYSQLHHISSYSYSITELAAQTADRTCPTAKRDSSALVSAQLAPPRTPGPQTRHRAAKYLQMHGQAPTCTAARAPGAFYELTAGARFSRGASGMRSHFAIELLLHSFPLEFLLFENGTGSAQ